MALTWRAQYAASNTTLADTQLSANVLEAYKREREKQDDEEEGRERGKGKFEQS